MEKWVSVKDKLPIGGVYVLAYNGFELWTGWYEGDDFIADNGYSLDDITHWIEIPKLPVSED